MYWLLSNLILINIYFKKSLQQLLSILVFTPLDVTSRAIPSGINAIPMAKKAGSTVPAVRIGCHAGNFCCLNFVSAKLDYLVLKKNIKKLYYLVPLQFNFDTFLLNLFLQNSYKSLFYKTVITVYKHFTSVTKKNQTIKNNFFCPSLSQHPS